MGTAYGETETISPISENQTRVTTRHGEYMVVRLFGGYWGVRHGEGEYEVFGSKDRALSFIRGHALPIG